MSRDDGTIVARPNEADRDDEERLTPTRIEQVGANRPFHRSAKFFRSARHPHSRSNRLATPADRTAAPTAAMAAISRSRSRPRRKTIATDSCSESTRRYESQLPEEPEPSLHPDIVRMPQTPGGLRMRPSGQVSPARICLRAVVREITAWLPAYAGSTACHPDGPRDRVPRASESLADPQCCDPSRSGFRPGGMSGEHFPGIRTGRRRSSSCGGWPQ